MLAVASVAARADDDPVRTIIFGSMEAGPSTFVTTGAKIALDDVNREGFAALVSVGTGARIEKGPAPPGWEAPALVRTTMMGSVLGGYQLFRDWGVAALFAGPEATFEALTSGIGTDFGQAHFGFRMHGEVWARPYTDTLATLTLIGGTARRDAYGRVSAGYRVFGAYLGPEAFGYVDDTGYRKAGIGLHATDFALGRFSFRVSAGAQYETETQRLAPYFALATWVPL